MEIKEAIEKVLDSINDDPKVARAMEDDTAGTLKVLVGDDVSSQDLANLTRGTSRIFSDKALAALFIKLLKNKKIRSGIVELLLKVGGVSLLLKLLSKSKDEDDAESSILSSLFGNSGGVSSLLGLIGKKKDELPALSAILGSSGKDDGAGLVGTILGSIIK